MLTGSLVLGILNPRIFLTILFKVNKARIYNAPAEHSFISSCFKELWLIEAITASGSNGNLAMAVPYNHFYISRVILLNRRGR